MGRLIVYNLDTNRSLVQTGQTARVFWQRMKGLLGQSSLMPGDGLWLVPCNSVHMFFMMFPVDVVFLDAGQQVIHLIEGLKPWQVSPIVWLSRSVLELPVGTIVQSGTQMGHRLQITEIER